MKLARIDSAKNSPPQASMCQKPNRCTLSVSVVECVTFEAAALLRNPCRAAGQLQPLHSFFSKLSLSFRDFREDFPPQFCVTFQRDFFLLQFTR